MEYRRSKMAGGTFFFTVVTHNRRKFLCEPENIILLRRGFRQVITEFSFKVEAIVVLPNHIHCIWTLPLEDNNFSNRWRLIKNYFSRNCDVKYKGKVSTSRKKKGEYAVWQRRFWEHQIKDENDYINHVNYIHYNPVKHGYVKAPKDWQYSSFMSYVERKVYDINWGAEEYIEFPDCIGNE